MVFQAYKAFQFVRVKSLATVTLDTPEKGVVSTNKRGCEFSECARTARENAAYQHQRVTIKKPYIHDAASCAVNG